MSLEVACGFDRGRCGPRSTHKDAIKHSCHLAILMGLAHGPTKSAVSPPQPCAPLRGLNPGRDKRLLLSAIGQCLKAQYDTLAAPVPPRLTALIKQLEKQKRRPNWTCSFPASSFHEDA